MRELLREVVKAIESGRRCVYCSLVETRGSTPQKAGASMLVFADGSQCGTLGGGCVEAEVKQRALQLPEDGPPQLMTFHLDNDYGWDDGLICGGRMSIVAQPLATGNERETGKHAREYYERFQLLVERGAGCTEVVTTAEIDGAAAGARILFDAAGMVVAALHGNGVPNQIREHLPPLGSRPRAFTEHGAAFLPILPRVRLLIVGGGHVGQAVGLLAAEADFDVWVLDDREQYASRARFPRGERLIVGDVGERLKELKAAEQITPSTYAIIVTRGHAHDEEALYHLATTQAGYVGMIGSKRKIRLIFDDLRAKGISEEALARVHAPLGLDIGSQTVPEIAVSIVAELIACRNLGRAEAVRLRQQVGGRCGT